MTAISSTTSEAYCCTCLSLVRARPVYCFPSSGNVLQLLPRYVPSLHHVHYISYIKPLLCSTGYLPESDFLTSTWDTMLYQTLLFVAAAFNSSKLPVLTHISRKTPLVLLMRFSGVSNSTTKKSKSVSKRTYNNTLGHAYSAQCP